MFSSSLSEIVLIVKDVKAAAKFYREVVRLIPRTEANENWAWFYTGEEGRDQYLALHKGSLLFEEHSPNLPAERWGRVHYAFNVPRKKLEEAADHVRSCGVEIYGPTYFEWMKAKSYYFYDPDGNLLEWWAKEEEELETEG